MKGAALTLVLVALAAGQANAFKSRYSGGGAYQGGYNCTGRIVSISCYVVDGVVKGLAYENDRTGGKTMCGYQNSASNPTLNLAPGENIVQVEACRGAYYGYNKITFSTDKGNTLTCGSGDNKYNYKPSNWHTYSKCNYARYDCTSSAKDRGRHLLESEVVEGEQSRQLLESDPDFFFKKNWGWGWNTKCDVYRSPRQASWSNCKSTGTCRSPWWAKKSVHKWGYQSNGLYFKGFKGANSYWSSTKNGKPTYYYTDKTLYNKQTKYCATKGCNYVPANYYNESYPLASFDALCDKDNYIYNVHSFCWNNGYSPLPPDNVLPVELIISGPDCITLGVQMDALLGKHKLYVDTVSPGLVKEITQYTNTYRCTPATPTTNATVVIATGWVPGANKTVADLIAFFSQAVTPGVTNLCELPPVGPENLTPCIDGVDSVVVGNYGGSKGGVEALAYEQQFTSYRSKYGSNKAKKQDPKWVANWPSYKFVADWDKQYKGKWTEADVAKYWKSKNSKNGDKAKAL